jgi:PAS domain S-box-containing protein
VHPRIRRRYPSTIGAASTSHGLEREEAGTVMTMLSGRASRPAAIVVAAVLALVVFGAVVTEPQEYPFTAFLLAPLGSAIIFGRRITAAVAVVAMIVAALVAILGDQYEGAALVFRLLFMVVASLMIVGLAGARVRREQTNTQQLSLLRERSEQRFHSLVVATSAIVWSVDANGRFVERQDDWEHYTGQTWPAYRDHGWLRAIHPEDRARFANEWQAALAAKRADELDVRLWHALTNDFRFVVARGVPLLERGVVREWVGTVTDVHDRTMAALRATEEAQLRTAVVQGLQEGVFVASADGTIVDVNDAWPRLVGFTRAELLGTRPPYQFWPDAEQHPLEFAALERMGDLVTGRLENAEYEVTFQHKEGKLFPTLISMSAIRDAAGELQLIVGTVKDMTRHAEAEMRLRLVAELTSALASGNEPEEIGNAALDQLMPMLSASHGTAFVLEPDASSMELVSERGLGAITRERWASLPLDLTAPGPDAVRSREILTIVEQEEFARRYPGLADVIRRLGMHTTVQIPLIKGSSVVGIVFLAFDHERPLAPDELDFLNTIGPIIAQALDRARLFRFQKSVASTLQRSMLSPQPATPVDLNVAARYVPAVAELSVGGDWYDVVPLDDGRVAIAVGDIVGRGINAAAVMGQLRSALSALARTTESVVEAVARLDRFAHGIEGAKATTLLYGVVDPVANTLCFTSAGHPPALVVDARGNAQYLAGGRGWPLAVADPDRPRPEAVAELPPGSTIVLFTDGLVERRTEALEDGLARLARAAGSRVHLPVERLCDELLDELVGEDHNDDIALVAMRMNTSAAASFNYRVPATPFELAGVRHALREWLAGQDLPASVRDDMLLAVGEACSNAVEHAYASGDRDTVVIEGFHTEGQLVCTVRDYGQWRPLVANPQRNRGLSLIREVTDDVSISTVRDGGTRVEMRRSIAAREHAG